MFFNKRILFFVLACSCSLSQHARAVFFDGLSIISSSIMLAVFLPDFIAESTKIARNWYYYVNNKEKLASKEIQILKDKYVEDIVKRHGNFVTRALYKIKKVVNPERIYVYDPVEEKELYKKGTIAYYRSGVHGSKKIFSSINDPYCKGILLHELAHSHQNRFLFGPLHKRQTKDPSSGKDIDIYYWREYNANSIMINELYKNSISSDLLGYLKYSLSRIDKKGFFVGVRREHPYIYGTIDSFCKLYKENPNDQFLNEILCDLNKKSIKYLPNNIKYFMIIGGWVAFKKYYFRNNSKVMKRLIDEYNSRNVSLYYRYKQYKRYRQPIFALRTLHTPCNTRTCHTL